MNVKLLIILVLLPIVMSQENYLKCRAHYDVDINNQNLTTCSVCEGMNITQAKTNVSVSISENLIGNRAEFSNISWFKVENHTMHYLPDGISSSFTNLSHLTIKNCSLKKISSESLLNFTNLLYLDLSWNEIEIIESNLFKYNQNLTTILLNNNWIYFIFHDAFVEVVNITFLQVLNNRCYSTNATNHLEAIMLPLKTLCPLDVMKLSNDISQIKSEAEIIEKSVQMLMIFHGILAAAIFALAILICCKLTPNNHPSDHKKVNIQENQISSSAPPIWYSSNDYEKSDEIKSKKVIEMTEVYDQVNYAQQMLSDSMENVNSEDFYAEIPIEQRDDVQRNDEREYIYSKI